MVITYGPYMHDRRDKNIFLTRFDRWLAAIKFGWDEKAVEVQENLRDEMGPCMVISHQIK